MNTTVSSAVTNRLAFFKGLQTLTNRIHASKDTDEIMLELAPELCSLFEAERFTIYALEEGGASIVTRVKTGLSGVQSIRLPIGENSIAGFVALSGQLVNIRDVYDDEELRRTSPHLALRREVDASTGFHSRQMLVAPIRDPDTGSLLGVVQLINTLNREPFSKMTEEGLMGLAQTLGVAFLRHNRQAGRLRSRFEALVVDGRITAEPIEWGLNSLPVRAMTPALRSGCGTRWRRSPPGRRRSGCPPTPRMRRGSATWQSTPHA